MSNADEFGRREERRFPRVSTSAESYPAVAHGNRKMMLPFEFTLATEAEPLDDPFAISRWEDDGGMVGRGIADGE